MQMIREIAERNAKEVSPSLLKKVVVLHLD